MVKLRDYQISVRAQFGVGMIEVLITLLLIMVAMLGIANLQSRLQLLQFETYQRSQAFLLLNDMMNRIITNRNYAASYVTTTPWGADVSCPTLSPSATRQEIDESEWCNALQGASETLDGNNVGTLLNARGCIEKMDTNWYLITVAWQGLAPISAPPASVTCGQNLYNSDTSLLCIEDRCRMTVTSMIRIAEL